jgi:hypothetical protein
MDLAEQLTRPPARQHGDLPDELDGLDSPDG